MKCNNFEKGCNWQGSVGTLDKHMAACDFECVPCKYQYVGCDVKIMRKDITQHEEKDDKKHLHLALQHITPTLSDGESLVFKMTEYSSKKRNKEVFFSDPFYTHLNGYKMRVKIHVNGIGSGEGTDLSISGLFLKGPFDNSLQWPFLGTVRFELLNQMGDYDHFDLNIEFEDIDDARPGGSFDEEEFISHSLLTEELPNKVLLLKNDSLYFKVTVTPSVSLTWLDCGKKMHRKLASSCEVIIDKEPLVFKRHGYTDIKENNNSFFSPIFFTSPSGYKMCIEIYPNGEGVTEDTHISLQFSFLKGPYDESLSWPFIGRVKLELLNQLSDELHHVVELTFRKQNNAQVNSYLSVPEFIRHSELQVGDKQFLMNDTLYFRVTVKVDSNKPWLICTPCI